MTVHPSQARVARRHLAQENPEVQALLREFFGMLHALYWSHWTSHWQVDGNPFYGDHLLFERLYKGVVDEIDTLAEKMVARYGPSVVAPADHFPITQAWIDKWAVQDDPYRRAFLAESDFQDAVKKVYDSIKAASAMSLGLDDYLMSIANDHETHMYLLQQRLGTNGALNKTAKVLSSVFVVIDPSDISEFGDIVFEADARHLANYIIGTGGVKWRAENSTLHDNKQTATQDAMDRLKKLWGGDIPPEALPSGTQIIKLSYFQRKAKLDGGAAPDMSAEGHFFDKPKSRETREFAESGSISNVHPVVQNAIKEESVASSPRTMRKQLAETPPDVTEILKDTPGSADFSTLSRYVVETEQTDELGVPQGHHEVDKHPDIVRSRRVASRWLDSGR